MKLIFFIMAACLAGYGTASATSWHGQYDNQAITQSEGDGPYGYKAMSIEIDIDNANLVEINFVRNCKARHNYQYITYKGKGREKNGKLEVVSKEGVRFTLEKQDNVIHVTPHYKRNQKIVWRGDCGSNRVTATPKFVEWVQRENCHDAGYTVSLPQNDEEGVVF